MDQTELLIPEIPLIDLRSNIKEVDVLLIFGIGDGSIYRSLRSWLRKEEGRYLVFIENEEENFLKAKESAVAKDLNVRLFYWKEGEEEVFKQIAWEFVFLRFGYAVLEPEMKAKGQEFFAYLEHYHRGVNLLAADSEDMGLKVLKNVMDNFSLFPKSRLGISLEGKCANIPAIICGAGPSLDRAIPFFKQAEDKALIIAGGSSIRALNAQGVSPSICAHFDPDPPYHRFLQQDSFEIPFFYQGRFCHTLLEEVHAPLFLMPDSGNYPLEGWMAAECGVYAEPFDSGWTAANFCTAIAVHLGCNPIIFVGMDFSCGPDAIYASEIPGEENRKALIEVKKGKLFSKSDWLMSAEWTAAFAKKHSGIQWINATDGGIDIPGVAHQKFSEVCESVLLSSFDVSSIVHRLCAEASLFPAALEEVNEIKEKVEKSFEKCLEICGQMLKVWEKHYPNSPLEDGEYVILDMQMQQEICHRYFLLPLWNMWSLPILRSAFHPLGQHVHRLLFFKQAIETHLPHL